MKTPTNLARSSRPERSKSRKKQENKPLDDRPYRLALATLDMLGRPRTCVLCLAGYPGGTFDNSGGLHHIFSRARLTGKKNMKMLWKTVNLAASCIAHHQKYGENPLAWTGAMVVMGFATKEDYVPYWDVTKSRQGEA